MAKGNFRSGRRKVGHHLALKAPFRDVTCENGHAGRPARCLENLIKGGLKLADRERRPEPISKRTAIPVKGGHQMTPG